MSTGKLIFFDTEFTELTQNAKLLSVALVADTGEKLYAECTDFNPQELSKWVKENVIDNFSLQQSNDANAASMEIKGTEAEIAAAIKRWLNQFEAKNKNVQFQFWGDSPAWDWILFCELFGSSFGRPANIHYMCMDIATVFQIKGYDPDCTRTDFLKENHISIEGHQHNALYDALVTQKCYEVLILK